MVGCRIARPALKSRVAGLYSSSTVAVRVHPPTNMSKGPLPTWSPSHADLSFCCVNSFVSEGAQTGPEKYEADHDMRKRDFKRGW